MDYYTNVFTPEIITELNSNEVFVFGSNVEGHHVGGAAKIAHEKFGAVWGEGFGHYGQTYAIPTLNFSATESGGTSKLTLEELKLLVEEFLDYAWEHPNLSFLVTKIGCGIAGFSIEDIGGLFRNTHIPQNVVLPVEFFVLLGN